MKKRNSKDSGSGSGFLFSGAALFGIFGTMMILRPMPYRSAGMIDTTHETSAVYAGNTVVGMGVFLVLIGLSLFYMGYQVSKD